MIDVSLRGVRCRAAQEILDLDGSIGVATEGTIVYELEGEGDNWCMFSGIMEQAHSSPLRRLRSLSAR